MGDCGCGSALSCGGRKSDQAALISAAITRLYPTLRWGEIDDTARYRAGVSPAVAQRIARAASETLKARTWYREGAEDELCDYVDVLCVGREPALLELRYGRVAPVDLAPGAPVARIDRIDESYLRIAFSSLLPAATVQEVQLHLRRDGDSYEIREQTRDGVYDPVLLKRLQQAVDLIRRAGLAYFDFGMLCEDAPREPVVDFAGYRALYGASPTACALLFSPRPPITTSTVLVSAASYS
jgi:hypothetical protein